MSEIKVDKISPQSGTELTLGDASDDFLLPSGAEIKAKSGSTITIESGATLANAGTATGFGGGKVLQVDFVHKATSVTGTTLIPRDNTIPQNTEGVEAMTLAFTPTSATSELLIQVNVFMGHSAATAHTIALFQDSTANALRASSYYASGANYTSNFLMNHLMVAATTSEITFKVRIGANDAGTVYLNGDTGGVQYGGVAASSIMIMEYTP